MSLGWGGMMRARWLVVGVALAGVARAASVPVGGTVAQSGAFSGIRTTLFTAWLPPGTGIGGLSGAMTLAGSDASFSEALVVLGTAPVAAPQCAQENGSSPAAPPTLTRFWAGILKSNGTAQVALSANVALPYPVPEAGVCAVAMVSAGYPYLSAGIARYTTTSVALMLDDVATTQPVVPVVPFGVGGEFRFVAGAQPVATYVGLQAKQALEVDAVAASVSAAPVEGAPPGSGWQPVPAGAWHSNAVFVAIPAAACGALHLRQQPGNELFYVLRNGTPALFGAPAGAVRLLDVPAGAVGGEAAQAVAYRRFDGRANGFSGRLGGGDCLVEYNVVWTPAESGGGVLDVENQSTVYLRPLPVPDHP